MTKHILDIDSQFKPLYGDQIIIPPNAIFWRGFDPKFPAVSDRPAYYGNKYIADGYAAQYGVTSKPFISTGYLRLLDYRFMKVLLSQIFNENKSTKSDINIIASTTLAFGLGSLKNQIDLLKNRYRENKDFLEEKLKAIASIYKPYDIIEQPGYRLGETTNDGYVMGFLKELFFGYIDGFISPRMYSPYHTEKTEHMFNGELIIFNPLSAGIELLTTPILPKTLISNINGFILQKGKAYMTIKYDDMETSFYTQKYSYGGAKSTNKKISYPLDYNYLIDIGHKGMIAEYNNGLKAGREWNKKSVTIQSYVPPAPKVSVSDFSTSFLKEVVDK